MKHHVKKFHSLSLPEAFELAQNISDGVARVDDIPGDGSRGISSGTRNSANSQSWKYFTISYGPYGAKLCKKNCKNLGHKI